MSANKLFSMTFVLLGVCALVAGCGSESVSPTVDEAPILPPENFAVTTTSTKATLTWDANSQGHFIGYNVYRSIHGQLPMTKLTPEPINTTMYVDDTIMPGLGYDYSVTSVSKNFAESQYVTMLVTADGSTPEGKLKDPFKQ